MATSPTAEGPNSDRSRILNQEPQFFKVVMLPSNQGLKIPDAFMRKYGRDLQHIVLLKVPTGASWQVELVYYENRTLMQRGWEEFAKYYGIEMFHFLVFRYLGNSQFLVLIFDPSALEIEYPVETNSDRSNSCTQTSDEESYGIPLDSNGKRARVEDIEEDFSIEILGGLTQEDIGESNTRSSHKLTMTENPGKNAVEADTNSCYHTKSSSNGESRQNQDGNSGKSYVETKRLLRSSKSKKVIDKEKFKSYEKAKAFTSSKPFFISVMQPSFLSYKSMRISDKFAREYLSMKKHHFLTLHVSGRNISWPVTVTIHHSGLKGVGAAFTSGWDRFVKDNDLRVGDVCVFELLLRARTFNVTIYRSAEDEIEP